MSDFYAPWDGIAETFPKLARCTHPRCLRTLTEDALTYCPHDAPFCEFCTWEDGCTECDELADRKWEDRQDRIAAEQDERDAAGESA